MMRRMGMIDLKDKKESVGLFSKFRVVDGEKTTPMLVVNCNINEATIVNDHGQVEVTFKNKYHARATKTVWLSKLVPDNGMAIKGLLDKIMTASCKNEVAPNEVIVFMDYPITLNDLPLGSRVFSIALSEILFIESKDSQLIITMLNGKQVYIPFLFPEEVSRALEKMTNPDNYDKVSHILAL